MCMNFIILSVLANFGAIVFGAIEFAQTEEKSLRLSITIGVCYYLQVRTDKKKLVNNSKFVQRYLNSEFFFN